jgi:hypothetical protein
VQVNEAEEGEEEEGFTTEARRTRREEERKREEGRDEGGLFCTTDGTDKKTSVDRCPSVGQTGGSVGR